MKKVLLTSAGLSDRLAREGISLCTFLLTSMGIVPSNILVYHLGYLLSKNYTRTYSSMVTNSPPLFRLLSLEEMNEYDVLLFGGGDAGILLNEINRTGFHEVIKQAVENGLFY